MLIIETKILLQHELNYNILWLNLKSIDCDEHHNWYIERLNDLLIMHMFLWFIDSLMIRSMIKGFIIHSKMKCLF